jgi:hypothetical protein
MHQPRALGRLTPINVPRDVVLQISAMHRLLAIVARAIAILGIGFISLFALDVFEPGRPMLEVAQGLFMHLLPSFGLIALLTLAWRWPLAGGFAFLLVGALPFVVLANSPWVNATLGGPFALAGLLFIAEALTGPSRPR